jgi:subtilisin-like proprotein convertase family protein/subtilisin family serine protease
MKSGGGAHGAGWVLYPEGEAEAPALRRVLHSRLLLKVKDAQAAKASLPRHGLRLLEEPSYAPGHWIVEAVAGGPSAALAALDSVAGDRAVESSEPLLLQLMERKAPPDDPLFAQQWHLQNTGQGGGKAGADAAVTGVWDQYQGQGIRIGIVDDGLDIWHPDLLANVDAGTHYDWSDVPYDTDPSPNPFQDFHGTAVGGIAGARGGNGLGVSGVAPKATLVGFRLIADAVTDAEIADAMTKSNHIIQIKNNSWGRPDGYPWIMYAAGKLTTAAMKTAATSGRGGLGTILVWAAGNGRASGDQGNKDSSANSIYSIAVGALSNRGALSTYSETGSHITVVAPSSGGSKQAVTTDLRGNQGYNKTGDKGQIPDLDYTNSFGGTSSASPVVSGVVALMLQANPLLNWRDVKEILLRSSTKLFPTDAGWTSRTGGAPPSTPLLKHHHSYGGGLVNAQAAVALAQTWTSLGVLNEVSRNWTWTSPFLEIPDNKAGGVPVVFDFQNITPMRVEHVTITVDIRHRHRGDLQITLKSPGGVISTLATKEMRDDGDDYLNWTFSSVRHWGESAQGNWQLLIKDMAAEDVGRVRSAKVTLFGTTAAPIQITAQPAAAKLLGVGDGLSLAVQTSGYGHATHQWRRGTTKVGTEATYAVPAVTTADAGVYEVTSANLTGTATSTPSVVGVVQRQLAPVTVNESAVLTLKVTAAGPGLSYQWLRGAEVIADDSRTSGAQSATLTIKNITRADQAEYVCRVSLMENNLHLETLPAAVTVRLKPVIVPPVITNSVVSGMPLYHITAQNGATKYSATGLPPGVTLNAKDGTLSGRPATAGTYTVKITASNLAGSSAVHTLTWTIEPFPSQASGVFTGLVERDAVVNAGLGGAVALTVTSNGSFTGSLGMGAKTLPLTGRIHALPGEADPVTEMTILRPKPLPPVQLRFTLHLSTGLMTGTTTVEGEETGLTARRCPWNATNPAPGAGAFTSYLQSAAVTAEVPLPQGDGFATLSVSPAGVAKWAGKMSDGAAITAGATMAADGVAPFHVLLYGGTGSVRGWTQVTNSDLLDGQLDWLKEPQGPKVVTRSYRAGFPLHDVSVIGGRYSKPAQGTTVLGMNAGSEEKANTEVQFVDGGLEAPIVQAFVITGAHAVKAPPSLTNPLGVKLTVNAGTGLLTGSFTLKDNDATDHEPPIAIVTRTAAFSGILVNRPGSQQGRGHFLLSTLPTTNPAPPTPILSGKFLFQVLP